MNKGKVGVAKHKNVGWTADQRRQLSQFVVVLSVVEWFNGLKFDTKTSG